MFVIVKILLLQPLLRLFHSRFPGILPLSIFPPCLQDVPYVIDTGVVMYMDLLRKTLHGLFISLLFPVLVSCDFFFHFYEEMILWREGNSYIHLCV